MTSHRSKTKSRTPAATRLQPRTTPRSTTTLLDAVNAQREGGNHPSKRRRRNPDAENGPEAPQQTQSRPQAETGGSSSQRSSPAPQPQPQPPRPQPPIPQRRPSTESDPDPEDDGVENEPEEDVDQLFTDSEDQPLTLLTPSESGSEGALDRNEFFKLPRTPTNIRKMVAIMTDDLERRKHTAAIEKWNKAALALGRIHNPFLQANAAFSNGLDVEIRGNDEEQDPTDRVRSDRDNNYRGSATEVEALRATCKVILATMPKLNDDLNVLLRDPDALRDYGKYVNSRVRGARGNDLGKLRDEIFTVIGLLPEFVHVKVPFIMKKDRGFDHELTASLLCPMRLLSDFNADRELFCSRVKDGEVAIVSDDFIAALYDTAMYDPDDYLKGLCRSPLLVKVFQWLFAGKRVAKGQIKYGEKTSGKPPFLTEYKIHQVTPELIAYAAVMLRFSLNNQEFWVRKDGAFDLPEMHYNVRMAFAVRDWAKETLAWWNEKIFGSTHPLPGAQVPRTGPRPESMAAQIAARIAAQGAASDAD